MNVKGIFITGGCGFIGSNPVQRALASGYRVVNLDKLTYAGNRSSPWRTSKGTPPTGS